MRRKFFITGLCMQGNKGGPAIALSLTNAIKKHIPDAEFIFSVPASDFELEKKWADDYGFSVVENIDLRHILPPFLFFSGRLRRLRGWIKQLRSSESMIQMSAISYVGPPSANPKIRTLLSDRFMDFYMSKLLGRNMYAWTQSYGPLSTWAIRFLAKCDLNSQPIIFCRGNDCQIEVQKLLPKKRVISYPDIAVTLQYDSEWAFKYLTSKGYPTSHFISLSPSAVIYSKSHTDDGQNEHIESLSKICEYVISRGMKVLLVPHTFRPGKHDPNICDYGTCQKLLENMKDVENVFLISDDLSAIELKSVISLASIHIGGRYHSVVAALSSGVPALSLSWHPKYRDVMRIYGAEDFVVEKFSKRSKLLLERLLEKRDEISSKISSAHQTVLKLSCSNVTEFIRVLKDNK